MQKNQSGVFKDLIKKSIQVKKDILEISYLANVGHIGSALSIADTLTVLYNGILKINPKRPLDKKRDRFILSKGHAAAALYSVLHRVGFFSKEKLITFCQDGGVFGTHPEYNPSLGIELSTGSLGHGLSVGAGLAYAFKKYSSGNHQKVYVLISDGELNEGSTWEAIMFIAHHKLDNLVAIVDDNKLQAYGKTKDIISMTPLAQKWKAFGWNVTTVNGHSIPQLYKAFNKITMAKKPYVVITKTTMGKDIPFMENKLEWHYLPLDKQSYTKALKKMDDKLNQI